MDDKEILLSACNVFKTYGEGDGCTTALNDVSFDIYKGELLVVLGSSGSGKSTLLNVIGGMDRPNKGSVVVNGLDIALFNDVNLTLYRRNSIGFVFQNFNLIPELTVFENVCLVNADKEAVKAVLETVGLYSKKDRYPSQLSGGEQQRVSIARAIVRDNPILLCDEPTGALDYETGRQILIELEKICRSFGKTVVIVTHTREIGLMADRVLVMRNGEIIKETVNEHIVTAENIEW